MLPIRSATTRCNAMRAVYLCRIPSRTDHRNNVKPGLPAVLKAAICASATRFRRSSFKSYLSGVEWLSVRHISAGADSVLSHQDGQCFGLHFVINPYVFSKDSRRRRHMGFGVKSCVYKLVAREMIFGYQYFKSRGHHKPDRLVEKTCVMWLSLFLFGHARGGGTARCSIRLLFAWEEAI